MYLGGSLNNFPDLKSVGTLRDVQITYVVVDENEISAMDAVLIATADMSVKYEGSFTGQSVFTINY